MKTKSRFGKKALAVLLGGIPLVTFVSCDPDTNAFNLVRINDLDDIVEDVLDSDLVEDYWEEDYYYYEDDCYDDCWGW